MTGEYKTYVKTSNNFRYNVNIDINEIYCKIFDYNIAVIDYNCDTRPCLPWYINVNDYIERLFVVRNVYCYKTVEQVNTNTYHVKIYDKIHTGHQIKLPIAKPSILDNNLKISLYSSDLYI